MKKSLSMSGISLILFLLPATCPLEIEGHAAGNDVWGPRVVRNDGEGVTIEFNYRFVPDDRIKEGNVLAYAVPRFDGIGWTLWKMSPGTSTARICMDCRNGRPPGGRTDKLFVYMNDRGNVFFRKEIPFPLTWNCKAGSIIKACGDETNKTCPRFRVEVREVHLDSTTANSPGVEFPSDRVTVTFVVANIGKDDFVGGDPLVAKVQASRGGFSASGSISARGNIFRIERLNAGREVAFKFRDAFYHGEKRAYTVSLTIAPGVRDRQTTQLKDCLAESGHTSYAIDDTRLHAKSRARQ